MTKKSSSQIFIVFAFAFIIFNLISCTTSKRLNYFQDLPEAEVVNLPPMVHEERIIEKRDDLQITITARSGEAASFFNKGGGAAPVTPGNVDAVPKPGVISEGYQVDENGFIEFPVLGKVKATGLTALQLKENLTKALSPYLKEPLVEVAFRTFNVSFLGEVRAPGIKTLSMQRTTLLEGLAAAGDLSINAKRQNILLYRDYKGERKIYRFDLQKKEVLNNRDVFQLRHNDVIYVQTHPSQLNREEIRTYTYFFSIAIGLTTLAISLARDNN